MKMKSKDESLGYWDTDTDFNGTLSDERLYKEKNETYFIYDIAYTLQRVDNHCVLGTIK